MNQYVAFSGGIDSTALALMLEDAQPVFTDTHDEFDELYAHLAHFEDTTGRTVVRITHPEWPGGLPEYIEYAKYLPNYNARFCTVRFKIQAYNLWLCGVETKEQYAAYRAERERLNKTRERNPDIDSDLEAAVCGGFGPRTPCTMSIALRADESPAQRVGNLTEMNGLSIRYPLREQGLCRPDVVAICLEHDLLPRYPVYMARGGCKGCFYKRKSEVQAMRILTPETYADLKRRELSVQDERGEFFYMFPNVGMSLTELEQQPTLFDTAQLYADAADTGDKGAACGLFCHR